MKFTALSLKKALTNVAVSAALLATPLIGISQITPPNEGGGNPEVPFDSNMNMIFLAAGVLFAVIITVRQWRKKASVTA
jgi:negative regulator of sigma E activity